MYYILQNSFSDFEKYSKHWNVNKIKGQFWCVVKIYICLYIYYCNIYHAICTWESVAQLLSVFNQVTENLMF